MRSGGWGKWVCEAHFEGDERTVGMRVVGDGDAARVQREGRREDQDGKRKSKGPE